jgi:hypothetical protein
VSDVRALAGASRTRAGLGFAWLGAVVLLVLIATAGAPAARAPVGAAHRIEIVERASALPLAAGEHRGDDAYVPLASPPLPRALPRSRSVAARGLPPPRAPTA